MKKTITAVLAVIFALLLPVSVFATSYNNDVDIDYSGVLGSYYEEDESDDESSSTRIAVTSDISYDTADKLYYIYASDIQKPFTSSVMDGMITEYAVSITAPSGVTYELYCDGELFDGDMSEITDIGDYVLRIKSNDGVSVQVLSFRIVGSSTGAVTGYTMPDGFALNSVTFNGEPVSHSSSYVSFSEEGDYEISYHCSATGVMYSLNINVDTTPPELKLEALKKGKAWGPVDISDVEDGGSVSVYRNGKQEDYTSVLTKSGQYELVVRDAAGNTTDYSFVIMVYFNSGSFIFFLVVILLFAAVVVYVVISRKKLRVR